MSRLQRRRLTRREAALCAHVSAVTVYTIGAQIERSALAQLPSPVSDAMAETGRAMQRMWRPLATGWHSRIRGGN
jgi:hypothetical protein